MANGFCECGCGRLTGLSRQTDTKRGYIKGQPVRFVPGHNRPNPGHRVDPETGCWLWQGHRSSSDGRAGNVSNGKGKLVSAYVLYYEQAKGPIPAGQVLDHVCRNPGCVNPDHLAAVSQAVNTRRARTTRLTLELAREIRALALSSSLSAREIGERYGVSGALVSGIKHGRKWRETDAPHLRRAS